MYINVYFYIFIDTDLVEFLPEMLKANVFFCSLVLSIFYKATGL